MKPDVTITAEQFFGGLFLSIVVGLAGCTEQATTPSTPSAASPVATAANQTVAKPTVVVSHSVLCDLTQTIAQATIDLTCLVMPGEDPHAYQATPRDRKLLESAQLILYGGYDLEPGIEQLIAATPAAIAKVAVSEKAVTKPLMGDHHDHDHAEGKHDHDHAKGDIAPDPHVWHDPKQGIEMAKIVRDQLQQLSPNNAALYDQTAQQFIDQLTQVDRWIAAQIATIPANQRKLVTTHDALGYYGQAYGIEILGTLQGLSTTEQPTPTRLKELVNEIKAAKVPTIFAEVSTNDKVLSNVAREAGVTINTQPIYADGIGQAGTPSGTYVGMLVTNTCTIVNGLGGQCSPFSLDNK